MSHAGGALRPLEGWRKLFHMSSLWAPMVYYHLVDRRTAVMLAAAGFLSLATWELARLRWPSFNELTSRILRPLMRIEESRTFTTATYFALSIFLSVYLFEKRVATAALIFLAVGDPMAALIGRKYGTEPRFLKKSLQGSAACFVACFVPASFVAGMWLAFWGALAATLFELLSSKMNDNLSIPLFSGLVMTGLAGQARLATPLQIGGVIFRVYLMFVVVTCLVGIVARHVLMVQYRRSYRYRIRDEAYQPSVSVLKPLRGVTDDLRDNLEALCRQEYPGEVELICVAEEEEDPGLMVARLVQERNPTVRIRIVCSGSSAQGPVQGRHGKIRNLIAGARTATGEVIVVSDADVHPGPGYLDRLVAPLADSDVGLVTALPVYHRARRPTEGLKALSTLYLGSLLYYPLAYFDRLDTALGTNQALRREDLTAVGGFEAVADQIADDHALARRIHALGRRIVLSDQPVPVLSQPAPLRSWWQQTRRRLVLLRTYAPERYPAYLFQSGPLHALILWAVMPTSWTAWLLGAVCGAEMVSAGWLALRYSRDRWTLLWLWLVLPLQLAGPMIWASAYFSRVVVWGGRKHYVGRTGVVTRIDG